MRKLVMLAWHFAHREKVVVYFPIFTLRYGNKIYRNNFKLYACNTNWIEIQEISLETRKGTKHKKDRAACKCLMIEVPKGIGLFEKEKKTGLVFFFQFLLKYVSLMQK